MTSWCLSLVNPQGDAHKLRGYPEKNLISNGRESEQVLDMGSELAIPGSTHARCWKKVEMHNGEQREGLFFFVDDKMSLQHTL